jgi:hypothetical protein
MGQGCRVPGTGFGVRPSAWTKDAGKVVSPLPLIRPRVGSGRTDFYPGIPGCILYPASIASQSSTAMRQ